MSKTLKYSEMLNYDTFEDRLAYLRLDGELFEDTFGLERSLNQHFYKTKEWRSARRYVILRDNGFDLGVEDKIIVGKILVHHINPITRHDIVNRTEKLFDPENLISVSHETHQAIHYGIEIPKFDFVERSPGDTKLW